MFANLKSRFLGKRFSNNTAKNRLQMVLVQDRSGLSSKEMDSFREDLLDVVTRYFDLERKSLDIKWERNGSCTALVINTPVVGRPPRDSKAAAAGQ